MRNNTLVSRSCLAVAVLLATAAATAGGCAARQPDPVNAVSGTLSYRPDMALSPDAVAYVRLADVTDGAVQGRTVVQETVRPDGMGNVPFTLSYKEKQIDPTRKYAVDVRLVDRGELLLVSDAPQPVITNGHPSTLDLTLAQVGGE